LLFAEIRFDRRFFETYTDFKTSIADLASKRRAIFSDSIAERSAAGREDDINSVAVERVSLSRRYCNSES
jgi:hypothetical protein